MKVPFQEIAARITGITTPVGGISWTPPTVDAIAARRIVNFLEDRRVLYSPYELEVPRYVVESILQIRVYLNGERAHISRSSPLYQVVSAMEAACRKFLDSVQQLRAGRGMDLDHPDQRMLSALNYGSLRGLDEWMFLAALGELRGVFGLCIGKIAADHHIDVEQELAAILPYSSS